MHEPTPLHHLSLPHGECGHSLAGRFRAAMISAALHVHLLGVAMKHTGTAQTIYEAAGGRDGLLRLASAWHTRVLEDEVVSHAFSHGYHPQHTERLAAYWAEALGGPTSYSDQYG